MEIRRIADQDQPRQKVHNIPSQSTAGLCGAHLSSPAIMGNTNKRITVQDSSGKKQGPYLKNNQCKNDWQSDTSDRVPVYQHEALSSIPSPAKRKNSILPMSK
jgi:hypothetical protein